MGKPAKRFPENIIPIREEKNPPKKPTNIFEQIEVSNINQKIKIRAKKERSGKYALQLDYHRGSLRYRTPLGMTITGLKETRIQDKEKFKLADGIRNKKTMELFQNEWDFELSNDKRKANFVSYFKNIVDKRKTSKKPWTNCYNYINAFTNGHLSFSELDEAWCMKYRDYLYKNVSPNSVHTYFARLKAALNMAKKDKIIVRNPAEFIKIPKEEIERGYLTLEEIRRLSKAECPKEDTKNAFIFSCFTGLRISDIKKITFDQIDGTHIRFKQTKTKGVERIKLTKNAREIITAQGAKYGNSGHIFKLSADTNTLNHLKKWAENARIKKHITWHVGRHSFATILMTAGADLYTVSKLLGHRDIKVTQIYAKLIDQKKDEAIDRIPEL